MLVHTDQKPFECTECDQAFRQKQLLKRHINLYHNPDYVAPKPHDKNHQCPSCDRVFRHKGNLIRHMAMHDPDPKVVAESKALKNGRKKRVQSVGGQTVEIYIDEDEIDTNEYEGEEDYEAGDDGEEDEDMEEIYVVDGDEEADATEDYVVLDVIPEDKDIKADPTTVTEEFLFDESKLHTFYMKFLF